MVFLDLPGAGENRNLDPGLDIAAMVPRLRGQLQKKIGSQKARFFCLSLGAMVAMEWMHQFPEDIVSAALINPSSKKHSPFHERLRFGAYNFMLKALVASSLRKREFAILEMISNRPEIYKDTASQ